MYLSSDGFGLPATTVTDRPRITSLLEKGSAAVNEDELLLGEHTYGVFDGATSLVSQTFTSGQTGGKLAARICKAVFADETRGLEEAGEAANLEIRRQCSEAGVNVLCKEELWSCSAAVVKLYSNHFDWCQIGDCQVLVIYEDNSYSLLGRTPDQDKETLRLWQQTDASSAGKVMEVMANEIIEVRRRTNIDFGVFNGEPEAMAFLRGGSESLIGVKNLLLFSDGLLLPQEDPGAFPEWRYFITLFGRGGLSEIRSHVRTLQLEDLNCRKYPRFKLHDDISGVAISF